MAKRVSVLDQLVEKLSTLPGIGRRSAERIAFHLLRQPAGAVDDLVEALRAFKHDLKVCSVCANVSESDPCPICADSDRDASLVLVVEQPTDIISLEQTGAYRGLYHVLMGRIAPLEAMGPGDLNVEQLLKRVEAGSVREVILGLNPTLEGDGTTMFLAEELAQRGVQVTRLARGLPAGAVLGALPKAVLSDALQGRRRVE